MTHVNVIALNAGHQTRRVNLFVSYLFLFVSALPALCPEAYNADIVPTEGRGGPGGKVGRRGIIWQRAANYVL